MKGIPLALRHLKRRAAASAVAIARAERAIGVVLPPSFRAFYRASNGIEGRVGRENYVQVWRVGEIEPLNRGYAASEFFPGLTLFASDGGEALYGFRRAGRAVSIVAVDAIRSPDDPERLLGATFAAAMRTLAEPFGVKRRARPVGG